MYRGPFRAFAAAKVLQIFDIRKYFNKKRCFYLYICKKNSIFAAESYLRHVS